MKTIKKVEITPEFVEYIPKNLEEGILYISKEFHVAVHLCLCGCKNKTVTPLNNDGWQMLIEQDKYVTLSPSIGNFQFACKSHYIIVRNKANFV